MDAEHDVAIDEIVGYGADAEVVRRLLREAREQLGTNWCYVFLSGGGAGGGTPAQPRERRLVAFASPDAALTFAQRNTLREETGPRLRRLSLAQLLLAMAREPAIQAVLIVQDTTDTPAGRFPDGLRIERGEIVKG